MSGMNPYQNEKWDPNQNEKLDPDPDQHIHHTGFPDKIKANLPVSLGLSYSTPITFVFLMHHPSINDNKNRQHCPSNMSYISNGGSCCLKETVLQKSSAFYHTVQAAALGQKQRPPIGFYIFSVKLLGLFLIVITLI